MRSKYISALEKLDTRDFKFKVTTKTYGSNAEDHEGGIVGHEDNLTIGIANIEAKVPDIDYNKRKIVEAIKVFKENKVNIVLIPEFCLTGYFWDEEKDCWAYMEQGVTDEHKAWIQNELEPLLDETLQFIIFNNIRRGPSDSKLYYNSTFVINKKLDYMNPKWIYDKTFIPGIEKVYTVSGKDDSLTIDTKWGRFGFSTCYDFCFSQLFQEMSKVDKVDGVFQLSSWRKGTSRNYGKLGISTDTYYKDLWNMLMPSTAARNQIWVISCNAVGTHDISGAEFAGSSGVWAPSGICLAQAGHTSDELLIVRNLNIRKEVKFERDDFNYNDEFTNIYEGIAGKRTFTRL